MIGILNNGSDLPLIDVEILLKLADECLHMLAEIGDDIDVASRSCQPMGRTGAGTTDHIRDFQAVKHFQQAHQALAGANRS